MKVGELRLALTNKEYGDSECRILGKKPLRIPWNLTFFFLKKKKKEKKHIYGAWYRVQAIITSIPLLNAVNF